MIYYFTQDLLRLLCFLCLLCVRRPPLHPHVDGVVIDVVVISAGVSDCIGNLYIEYLPTE